MLFTQLMLAVFRYRRRPGCLGTLIGLAILAIVLNIRVLVQWVSGSVDDRSRDWYDHPRRQFLSNSTQERYVSLCKDRTYGDHRIGNHLFMLAAMLFVTEQTNRSILMKAEGWCLDEVFELNSVLRYRDKHSSIPGSSRVLEPQSRYPQSLDDHLSVVNGASQVQTYEERTIQLCGFYQTSFYAEAIDAKLRRMLQFIPDIKMAAEKHLAAACPKARRWFSTHACIGVHVRRGDFLTETLIDYGLTTLTDTYLRDAMQYFIDRYQRVQFVIASEDQQWVRTSLRAMFNQSVALDAENSLILDDDVLVTLSQNQSAAVDFAALTMCDGLVISTGSFGWWAAWLANKTTVYYANWPRKNSGLASVTDPATYFPHNWIPMK